MNNAKILLANEATKICHGEEESKKAEQNSLKIFSNYSNDAELPEKNKFSLDEKEVIKLMKENMKRSSFLMWRKRVRGRKTKISPISDRFKSSNQKS